MRKGALGLAVEISRDCDAADVYVHLVQALGAINLQDNGRRFGGRWIAQYAITCQERLSREEWTKACAETNMQVDISSDQRPSSAPGGQEIVLIYYPQIVAVSEEVSLDNHSGRYYLHPVNMERESRHVFDKRIVDTSPEQLARPMACRWK